MERLIGIGEAAQALGVWITALRRWEATGKLSAIHTAGDQIVEIEIQAPPATSDLQRTAYAHLRDAFSNQRT